MLFANRIPTVNFWEWIKEDRENRRLLWWSAAVSALVFTIFKLFYPFPNFMPPDSYSYLEAAYNNQAINMWAIGYSKFLRAVSCFVKADLGLVIIQYVLLQASLLYFLFTLKYLLGPSTRSFRILLGLNLLNPLVPHISNFVSSDALFAALSLGWFTQLLWIIKGKPSRNLLIMHAFVLLGAFMVRYNGLYYPIFSIVAIFFAHLRSRLKALAIGLIVLLIGFFVGRTMQVYYKETKTWQYSAFGGWQIASNALYGYAYAENDPPEKVPAEFRALHVFVNSHMDSIRRLALRPDNDVAIYYLWDFKSPLKLYMESQTKKDTATKNYFHRWAKMGSLYASYGRWLVKEHPLLFLHYYAWPNFIKYYAPPAGFMGSYVLGNDKVDFIAARWFGWKKDKVYNNFKDKKIQVSELFPTVLAITNLVFVGVFLAFAGLGGWRQSLPLTRYILWCTLSVWIVNMGFSVIAAPIELRYQIFSLLITFGFMWVLINWVIIQAWIRQPEKHTIAELPTNLQ